MTGVAPPTIDLEALLRRLHLPTVRRLYPHLAQRAEAEDMAYRDFLSRPLNRRVVDRPIRRLLETRYHSLRMRHREPGGQGGPS